MTSLISLHNAVFSRGEALAGLLPLLARFIFAAVLFMYFWASGMTKLGDGILGLFNPSLGAYAQIFPKAMEAVSYDVTQLGVFHRLVVVADTSRNQPAISRGLPGQDNRLQVAGMTQKLQAQLAGLGVGTLPLHRVQPLLDSGDMLALPLAEPLPEAPCHLAWKTTNRGRALALVVAALQEAAGSGDFADGA